MAARRPPTVTETKARKEARERLGNTADRVAVTLACDPEDVMVEPPNYLSLTVDQVERLLAMIPPRP